MASLARAEHGHASWTRLGRSSALRDVDLIREAQLMYDNDLRLMQQLTVMRGVDRLREAEEERRFALARQARMRRSWIRVGRDALSAVLPGVRSWLGTGATSRPLDGIGTRAPSR